LLDPVPLVRRVVASTYPVNVIGVDACRGKWLAIVLRNGRFAAASLVADVAGLAAASPDAAAIGVDIPIGLPETPLREADSAARDFVGERRSSVFPTFPAIVSEAPTYDEAKAVCVAQGWPKPSRQSYGMRHRILEIASLAAVDERIFEVHPEVSFRELVGRPLAAKRTAAGASERRRGLTYAGIELPDLPYPLDDVLDAAVSAWSAMRYARGEALPLPEWQRDRIGPIWR
jgi:predicted RNase H-like nuclease